MRPFEYTAAATLTDALRAATGASTRFVAGGTTLVDLMKLEVETPAHVVDVNPLSQHDPSLAAIAELPDGGLRIGALARMSDVGWDPRVAARWPAVSQSLLAAASGQLRNMATLGGNLLQRTRCPYFRDVASPCNKRDPGSGCGAITGMHRGHAVLGTSEQCIATHPSDLAVALAALDAIVHVRGLDAGGSVTARSVPAAELHALPEDHPEIETVLGPGEMLVAIELPPLPFARRSLYLKVRDRASFAFALASAAVALDIRDGTIHDARVALGGVATTPWRSRAAERELVGQRADVATYRAAAAAALQGAVPREHNGFKIALAQRTLVRALERVAAIDGTGEEQR